MEIEEIDIERQIIVHQVLQSIHVDVEWLLENTQCCDKCTTWNLGKIFRQIHSLKLYPFPEKPYTGVSFADLRKKLDEFKVSDCHATFHPRRVSRNTCEIIPYTQWIISTLDDDITGLDLETYKTLAAPSLP